MRRGARPLHIDGYLSERQLKALPSGTHVIMGMNGGELYRYSDGSLAIEVRKGMRFPLKVSEGVRLFGEEWT